MNRRGYQRPFLIKEKGQGLSLASQGQVLTAPNSFMHFDAPKGDIHIKSGGFLNGEMYVIKIASVFYKNPVSGLQSSNGAMYYSCKGRVS